MSLQDGVQYSGHTSTCAFESVWLRKNEAKRKHIFPNMPPQPSAAYKSGPFRMTRETKHLVTYYECSSSSLTPNLFKLRCSIISYAGSWRSESTYKVPMGLFLGRVCLQYHCTCDHLQDDVGGALVPYMWRPFPMSYINDMSD